MHNLVPAAMNVQSILLLVRILLPVNLAHQGRLTRIVYVQPHRGRGLFTPAVNLMGIRLFAATLIRHFRYVPEIEMPRGGVIGAVEGAHRLHLLLLVHVNPLVEGHLVQHAARVFVAGGCLRRWGKWMLSCKCPVLLWRRV